MTSIKTGLLASAAFLAFASAANAADPILPPPVIPPAAVAPLAHDWTGFYAGINAGYGFGEVYNDAGVTEFDRVNGLIGGVQVGANAQFDMFVLGVEGDIQLSGMSQTLQVQDPNVTAAVILLDATASLEYFGTVRARAGVAMDNVMPYLTGGFAFGGGKLDIEGYGSDTANHWGWTVGGGVEIAMDDSISFKGEYLYTDLGQSEYTIPGIGSDDLGLRFHTVRAGVNFHF